MDLALYPSVCFVLPVYNEESGIFDCVEQLVAFSESHFLDYRIVACDDGSTDRSGVYLKALERKHSAVHCIYHQPNQGYGAANRAALEYASKNLDVEYLIVMDSDSTQSLDSLVHLLRKANEGFDLIKASRYLKGGQVVGVPFSRRLPSVLGNGLARLRWNFLLTDYTNGFRAIRSDVIPKILGNDKGFSYILEEMSLAMKNGLTITEFPYVLSHRVGGSESKFVYDTDVYLAYLKHLF